MPRYFFNLYDDIAALDEEGRELPDADAARSEAERTAREMAAVEVLAGRLVLSHRIDVVDDAEELVATVCFGDAVEVLP